MEELRSTEVLDREILEDARKKAARFLKNADQLGKAADAEWEKKLESDLLALSRKNRERIENLVHETNARFPLDTRRMRAERAERKLREAMEGFIRSLPYSHLIDLLGRELRLREAALSPDSLIAEAGGLETDEAAALLATIRPAGAWTLGIQANCERAKPWLVIHDDTVTVRIGIDEIGETLLREKRAELATALLGPEALND